MKTKAYFMVALRHKFYFLVPKNNLVIVLIIIILSLKNKICVLVPP